GPMARSITDLATLLDAMVGYDSEDPLTALGVGKSSRYAAALDRDSLKGARLGVLRDPMGPRSDPASEDFRKLDAVFERNLTALKSAGATLVDPLVIPNLKELMANRESDSASSEEALRRYLARNPDSPIKSRSDIASSPELEKSIPPASANQWKVAVPPDD